MRQLDVVELDSYAIEMAKQNGLRVIDTMPISGVNKKD